MRSRLLLSLLVLCLTPFAAVAFPFSGGNSGTAYTANWNNGQRHSVTMTGNCTFTFSNPVNGGVYFLILTQDATGSRTATWPAAVSWPGGTAPTLSGANKVDIISFYYNGTTYFGQSSLNY